MTRPAVAAPAPWRFPETVATRLANGTAVRGCHLPRAELAAARLVLPAGAAAEEPGAWGASYAAVAALVHGGLAEAVEELGATANAEVSWDATTFVVNAPRDVVADAAALVARAVVAGVGEDGVARACRARLDAVRAERPAARAEAALAGAMFGQSRYGAPPGGREADLAALTPDAVRAHLAAALPGATLVVAGDLDRIDAPALGARLFDGWPADPHARHREAATPARGETAAVVVPAAGPAAAVALGCPTPPRDHASYAALTLAAAALSGTSGARLNTRLRVRERLTYGAYGAVEGWRLAGRWFAAFACPAGSARAAVNASLDEVRDVASGGLTAAEIAAVRGHLAGAAPLHLHTPAALATAVAENVALGVPDDAHARLRDALLSTSDDDVREAAATWLRPSRVAVAVAVAGGLS